MDSEVLKMSPDDVKFGELDISRQWELVGEMVRELGGFPGVTASLESGVMSEREAQRLRGLMEEIKGQSEGVRPLEIIESLAESGTLPDKMWLGLVELAHKREWSQTTRSRKISRAIKVGRMAAVLATFTVGVREDLDPIKTMTLMTLATLPFSETKIRNRWMLRSVFLYHLFMNSPLLSDDLKQDIGFERFVAKRIGNEGLTNRQCWLASRALTLISGLSLFDVADKELYEMVKRGKYKKGRGYFELEEEYKNQSGEFVFETGFELEDLLKAKQEMIFVTRQSNQIIASK